MKTTLDYMIEFNKACLNLFFVVAKALHIRKASELVRRLFAKQLP